MQNYFDFLCSLLSCFVFGTEIIIGFPHFGQTGGNFGNVYSVLQNGQIIFNSDIILLLLIYTDDLQIYCSKQTLYIVFLTIKYTIYSVKNKIKCCFYVIAQKCLFYVGHFAVFLDFFYVFCNRQFSMPSNHVK